MHKLKSYFTRLSAALLSLIACVVIVGCGSDSQFAPIDRSGSLYARPELNHHAILLSMAKPYDTLTLKTRPISLDGSVWNGGSDSPDAIDSINTVNPPVYYSQDSSKVKVSSNGVLQAVGITTNTGIVRVIVSQTINGINRLDTAVVRILNVANPPRIKSYKHRPADSLKIPTGASLPLVITAIDSNDKPITNVATFGFTSDSTVVGLGSRRSGHNPTSVSAYTYKGRARIISQAVVYGIAVADTFEVVTTYPNWTSFQVSLERNSFGVVTHQFPGYEVLYVSSGANVDWTLRGDTAYFKDSTIDVIFEDSLNVLPHLQPARNTGGGNIYGVPVNTIWYRRFLKIGIYKFRIEPYGIDGVLEVKE